MGWQSFKKDLPNLLDCLTELFEDSKKEVSNLIEKNKAAKDKKQSIKSVAGANSSSSCCLFADKNSRGECDSLQNSYSAKWYRLRWCDRTVGDSS